MVRTPRSGIFNSVGLTISHVELSSESYPKYLRMANLAVLGSFKVNGVAEVCSVFFFHLFCGSVLDD